jgi:uncharacterized protein (TIGR02246 family)
MTAKTESMDRVVVERTLNAPVAQVWNALTDADQMRAWYFELKEFKPEPGFEFEFVVEHDGNSYHHLCKVTEVIPEKKLAYTWRYKGEPGDSLVTFELFPDGNKTKLRLTHEGLETFPKTPAYARKNFEMGWTSIATELAQFLDEQQIREVISTWMRATTVGDLPQVLSLMAEDVVFLLPGQPPMRGREAFAAGFRAALQHVRIEAVSDVQEIRITGDHAYCWSQLSLTITPLQNGSPKRRAGSTLSVFRKESDGHWRLFRDANLLSEV